jgi:hypothetical protein
MKKKLVFQKKIISNLQPSELQHLAGGETGGMMCTDYTKEPIDFDKSRANLCVSQNICPSKNVCYTK